MRFQTFVLSAAFLLPLLVTLFLSPPSTEGQHLRLISYMPIETGPGAAATAMMGAFNARPNASSSVDFFSTSVGPPFQMDSWTLSFGGPDIIPVTRSPSATSDLGKLVERGLLANLTDIWMASGLENDVMDFARDFVTSSTGAIAGIPVGADTNVCMYRKSIFSSLNITAPGPGSNLDDLHAICEIITASGFPCLGIDVAPGFGIPPTYYFDILALRMYGRSFYEPFTQGAIPMTDPRVLDVFSVLTKLTTGSTPDLADKPSTGDFYYSDTMLADNLAIFCGFEISSIAAIVSGVPNSDLGAFPFPEYTGPRAYDFPASPASTPERHIIHPDERGEIGALGAYGAATNGLFLNQSLEVLAFMARQDVLAGVTPYFFSGYPIRKSLRPTIVGERVQISIQAVEDAGALYFRTSDLAGEPELYTPFSELITQFQRAHDKVTAMQLANTTLPSLEAIRIRVLFSKTGLPVIDPAPGTYTQGVQITLTPAAANAGAVVFYTLDGSEPSTSSSVYSSGIRLEDSGSYVIRAVALQESLSVSDELRSEYVINIPPPAAMVAPPSDSSTSTLLVAILIPALVCVTCIGIAVAVFIYRKKTVTYTLSSDSDLVIPPEELFIGASIGMGAYGEVFKGTWRTTPVAIKQMFASSMGGSATGTGTGTGTGTSNTAASRNNSLQKLASNASGTATRKSRKTKFSRAALKAFVEEATHLARLRHPNILIFMGITVKPCPGIVTEFMNRGSLYSVLHDRSLVLPVAIRYKWAHNIAQGIAFLASSSVVHGDIKSLNVLFDSSWIPKICDFGLSALVPNAPTHTQPKGWRAGKKNNKVSPGAGAPGSGGEGSSAQTSRADLESGLGGGGKTLDSSVGGGTDDVNTATVGTLFWSAPEVLDGGPQTVESDIYALAVTVWELATRKDVYEGENPLAVAVQVVQAGRRPDLGMVPSSFETLIPLVESMWVADPAARVSLSHIEAVLSTTYNDDTLVFPHPVSRPTGETFVTHVADLGYIDLVLSSVTTGLEALAQWKAGVEEATEATHGAIAAHGVASVSVLHQTERDATAFHAALSRTDTTSGITAGITAFGEIGYDMTARTLNGPVFDAIRVHWRDTFGSGSGPAADLDFGGCDGLAVGNLPTALQVTRPANYRPEKGGNVFLWSGPDVVHMCNQASEQTHSLYARVFTFGKYEIHTLMRQDDNPDAATTVLGAVAASRAAAQLDPSVLDGPVGVCLAYPNVSLVFDAGHSDPDSTLEKVMEAPLRKPVALAVGQSVASALSTLHANSIAHGSLKPENITVDMSGSPTEKAPAARVAGACLFPISMSLGSMTLVPSVAYQSPEMLHGDTPSATCDIFVLGTILYEMYSGSPAFAGSNAIQVSFTILSGKRPDLDTIASRDPHIADLIRDCWSPDPSSRPTADQVLDRLA